MAVRRNRFALGPNNTAITVGNSGGTNGNAFNEVGGTPIYSNGQYWTPGFGARTNSGDAHTSWDGLTFTTNTAYTSMMVYRAASSSTFTRFGEVYGNATTICKLWMSGGDVLIYRGQADELLLTVPIPLNSWCRLEVRYTINPTNSQGTVQALRYDNPNTNIANYNQTSTTETFAAPSVQAVVFCYSANNSSSWWLDDIGTDDVAIGNIFRLSPPSIPSAEAFGTAQVRRMRQDLAPPGIPSAEAFGTAAVSAVNPPQTLSPSSILSREAFGDPAVAFPGQILRPSGIPSLEAFGNPSMVLEDVEPVLIPPTVEETPMARNILHIRFHMDRGISILQRHDGSWYTTRYPGQTELEEVRRWWMGGYTWVLSPQEVIDLTAAGFGQYIHIRKKASQGGV